jgi:hypothetical protein
MSVNAIGPAPLPEKSEPVALAMAPYVAPRAGGAAKTPITAFEKADGPSFSDLIDIINPLQHIPVVNIAYQQLTGDTEGAVADVVGGAIYGGFIGLGAAVAGLMVQEASGKRLGDHVMAMFTDHSSSTALAKADSKAPPATAAAAATPAKSAKPVMTAAAEPPAVPASPLEAVTKSQLSSPAAIAAGATAADTGPVRAGDYLIFGGAGNAPVSIPTASSNRPMALTPASSTSVTPDATSTAPGPSRNGDFLVFGSNGTPIPTTLPGGNAALPPTPAVAAVAAVAAEAKADDDAAAAPHLQQQAATGSDQQRIRPVPARIGRSIPPPVLPMPTTGPGAVPGGHSQAMSANGMGASASPLDTSASTNGQPNQWFSGAFSQAMDKYQRASRLGGDGTQPMLPTSGANSDTAAATLN